PFVPPRSVGSVRHETTGRRVPISAWGERNGFGAASTSPTRSFDSELERGMTALERGRSKSFVFYEPSGTRWRRFIRVIQGGGILAILALASGVVGVVMTPKLPTLILPAVPHVLPLSHTRGLTSDQGFSPEALYGLSAEAGATPEAGSLTPHLHSLVPTPGRPPLVFGYYVNWDA